MCGVDCVNKPNICKYSVYGMEQHLDTRIKWIAVTIYNQKKFHRKQVELGRWQKAKALEPGGEVV